MARKRRPVNDAAQRLLASKLRLLQEGAPPQHHAGAAALDLLTGRSVGSDTRPVSPMPGSDEVPGRDARQTRTSKRPASNRSRAGDRGGGTETASWEDARQRVRARTVYLSDADIRRVDEIGRAWEDRLNRRVSRSEVFRQALEKLLEPAAVPGVPEEQQ